MGETEDYDKSATPTAHAESHQKDGSDEISLNGLSGESADEQKSTWSKISGKPTTFPPVGHHSSHETGGEDPVNTSDIAIKFALLFGG